MTHSTVMSYTQLNTDCCSTVKQLAGSWPSKITSYTKLMTKMLTTVY